MILNNRLYTRHRVNGLNTIDADTAVASVKNCWVAYAMDSLLAQYLDYVELVVVLLEIAPVEIY